MVVIWDATSASPVKHLQPKHPGAFRAALDLSPDAMFVVTLSETRGQEDGGPLAGTPSAEPQQVALWEWTADREDPLHVAEVDNLDDAQRCVRFNPANVRQIVTNGDRKTIFWSWAEGSLQGYLPRVSKRDFLQGIGRLTCSCFLPDTMQAITANTDGDVVVWDGSLAATDDGEEPLASVACDQAGAAERARCAAWPPVLRDRYLCVAAAAPSVAAPRPLARRAAPRKAPAAPPAPPPSSNLHGPPPPFLVAVGEQVLRLPVRLEAWFETWTRAPCSATFHPTPSPRGWARPLAANPAFQCPDFVAATSRAYIVGAQAAQFEEVDPGRRRGTVLVQGAADQLAGIACHPRLPRLLLCCYSGDVQLWDHQDKTLLMARAFDASKFRPQCAAFHPRGTCLALGFTSGALKLVDPQTLEDCCLFRVSAQPILEVRFSPGGRYMACYDAGFHVALWRYTLDAEAEAALAQEEQYLQDKLGPAARLMRQGWEYIGRHRSHTMAITGLEFGLREDGRTALASAAEDRTLVEYDLEGSSLEAGLLLLDQARGEGAPARVEQVARPTCLAWHPLLGEDYEDRVVTANDEFKLRQWNGDNRSFRRMSLGPTFGGPLNRLMSAEAVPVPAPSGFMAYTTAEKVIGLLALPLDGDPASAVGLIAHPGPISGPLLRATLAVLAGRRDLSVNMGRGPVSVLSLRYMWEHRPPARLTVRQPPLPPGGGGGGAGAPGRARPLHGPAGGGGGAAHRELVDYFYYCQLRAQGEDTTEERRAEGRVKLAELPNLMRALGHYPSEAAVAEMVAEVKYSRFTATGRCWRTWTFRLRSGGFSSTTAGAARGDGAHRAGLRGAQRGRVRRRPSGLAPPHERPAERRGAPGEEDLKNCLQSLVGERRGSGRAVSAAGSRQFAEDILGFEDYEEDGSQEFQQQEEGFGVGDEEGAYY
ncbi:unnamed protein product [Heterosigma akashiwo]